MQEYRGTTYAEQYNFGVHHELMGGFLLSAAFVGTRGLQINQDHDINYPRTVGNTFVRPYDGFSTLLMKDAGGVSSYNSLQATAKSASPVAQP